ncbi:MAG: hypothetical protein GWP74_02735 [Proteobacteria bacterium]|nr:hypothetical protein [Pseudomonadota bacterium]
MNAFSVLSHVPTSAWYAIGALILGPLALSKAKAVTFGAGKGLWSGTKGVGRGIAWSGRTILKGVLNIPRALGIVLGAPAWCLRAILSSAINVAVRQAPTVQIRFKAGSVYLRFLDSDVWICTGKYDKLAGKWGFRHGYAGGNHYTYTLKQMEDKGFFWVGNAEVDQLFCSEYITEKS